MILLNKINLISPRLTKTEVLVNLGAIGLMVIVIGKHSGFLLEIYMRCSLIHTGEKPYV